MIAERIFREVNVFQEENIKELLVQEAIKNIPFQLLKDRKTCSKEHRLIIIKKVLNKYFNVRLHYASKCIFPEESKIRSKNTKIVLFKNQ